MKSKIAIVALLIFVFLTGTALAKPIIKADRTYFDVSTGLYVLNGNVYVEVGNRIIKANQAKVSISSLEVWATGGISLTQDDINFTGDSVYVYGTQKKAQIAGGVNFSRTGISFSADSVEYDWGTKIAVFSGNVQINQNGVITSADRASYDVANNTLL